MEVAGVIHEIFEAVQVKDGFKKREFVLKYAENPKYPEYLKFELIQDNCDNLDDFKPGQEVKVLFNIRGREWTNPQGEKVYFNSLQAWRMIEIEHELSIMPEDIEDDNPIDDLPF